jgi:hypothetical protein
MIGRLTTLGPAEFPALDTLVLKPRCGACDQRRGDIQLIGAM